MAFFLEERYCIVWLNSNVIKLVGIRYVHFVKPGSNKTPFDIIICNVASHNNECLTTFYGVYWI